MFEHGEITADGATWKRSHDMAGPNAEALIRHAIRQVGRGGTVYVVHSGEELQSYEDFKGHAETYAQNCEAAKMNVTVLVIEEKQLPPLGIW